MKKNRQIIIIGGGVIGLACAHYLMNQGNTVTIIEEKKIGSGSSHGNCGLLYFSDVIPLCSPGAVSKELVRTVLGTSPLYIKPEFDVKRLLWLFKFAMHCRTGHMNQAAKDKFEFLNYSAQLFNDLFESGELQCDFENKGFLSVFKSEKNLFRFNTTNEFLQRFDLGYTLLNKDDALNLEPALSSDIAGAWYSTVDQHLRPEHFISTWKHLLLKKGLEIHEHCRVTGFIYNKGQICGVKTSLGNIYGDAFVIAAGAWSSALTAPLNNSLPVIPGKGYSITMGRPEICPKVPCILYEKNMVVTPWKSGYRLGGTMEFSGFSHSLNPKRLNKLLSGATEYMRTPFGKPVIEEWTGLRPMTYDDMPIIGRIPGADNLLVATGHGMLGLTLATGTGKIICDMIMERELDIDPAPYSPNRF